MKGIAIGLSESSKALLERLHKAGFVQKVFLAKSKNYEKTEDIEISSADLKKILKNSWKNLDLIIFVGAVGVATRLIAPMLISKDHDPGVIVMDKKCSKLIPLLGLHQNDTQNIAYQISHLFDGEVVNTNNSIDENFLKIDSFGISWGWKRSGSSEDWSKLVISQSKLEEIYFLQTLFGIHP